MPTVFEKLNLKDQKEILVIDAPASFEPELTALDKAVVRRRPSEVKHLVFLLAFATKQKEVDALAKIVAGKAAGDAVIWVAYPKGTSKKYTCEFNRDTGWDQLGKAGFEPVRQIAIDADWTALRFRQVEHIKSLTRRPLRPLSRGGQARLKRG